MNETSDDNHKNEAITQVNLGRIFGVALGRSWVLFAAFAVVSVGFQTRDPYAVGVAVTFFGGFYFWSGRLALVAFPQGLAIRNWFGHRQVLWSEIDCAFGTRESGRVQLMLKLKNGDVLVPRALQRTEKVNLDLQLFGLIGLIYTINYWIEQHREGKLVEPSYEPVFPPEISDRIQQMDEIVADAERLEAAAIEAQASKADGDQSEVELSLEQEDHLRYLEQRMETVERELTDLINLNITDTLSHGYQPHRRGSAQLYAFSALAGIASTLALLVALALGPFGQSVDALVVEHAGSDPKTLATIVEFDDGTALARHEIFRTSDEPPYTPIGQRLKVVYFKGFSAFVAEASSMNAGLASLFGGALLLASGGMYALGRLLRYGRLSDSQPV